SIRLLTLNVSPGTDVSCTLSEVDLAESPVYNALSYTWGSPSAAATARGVNAERSYEPIWIDAVCINQEDTKEKTAQVRLMTKIYSQSAHVYVWFGDAY
ncbi:heterokaryon incompatibility protein-domain-containing protein, partial [Leptodontidium sp. 2 PMI_412]